MVYDTTQQKGVFTVFMHSFEQPTNGTLGNRSCWEYLDQTLGKFPPVYGPHLSEIVESGRICETVQNWSFLDNSHLLMPHSSTRA